MYMKYHNRDKSSHHSEKIVNKSTQNKGKKNGDHINP